MPALTTARRANETGIDEAARIRPVDQASFAGLDQGLLDGSAPQAVAAGILADHLLHCLLNARASDIDGQEALAEIAGTIRQVIRL